MLATSKFKLMDKECFACSSLYIYMVITIYIYGGKRHGKLDLTVAVGTPPSPLRCGVVGQMSFGVISTKVFSVNR